MIIHFNKTMNEHLAWVRQNFMKHESGILLYVSNRTICQKDGAFLISVI